MRETDGDAVTPQPATEPWRPSNGTEGDAWQEAWCRSCVNDVNEDCEILLKLFIGEHHEAVRRGPMWSPATSGYCLAWAPIIPPVVVYVPPPEIPGQLDLTAMTA